MQFLNLDPKRAEDFFNGKLQSTEPTYTNVQGIAVIPIVGGMVKTLPLPVCGMTSYNDIQDSFNSALDDDKIEAIVLYIDSPGGEASGLFDVADLIFNSPKPVMAWCQCACSAGYDLASQADYIAAGKGSEIGSIGTMIAFKDQSALYAANGVAVQVFASASLKGLAAPGTSLTDDQKVEVQRVVNEINSVFISNLIRSRDVDVAKVNTGQVWLGANALALGLIDEIVDFQTFISNLILAE